MFMHLNFTHFFNNFVIIIFIGSFLEKFIGHLRFLLIYLCSGVVGGFFTVYGIDGISVGASGSAFGLLGAMVEL